MNNIIATDKEQLITYTEIFGSLQGEGMFTGIPTVWLRFFLCNLQCSGFGQEDPTDPSTYILPYKDFDVSTVKVLEELPVFEYGCDSSYSWSKKYRHLAHKATAREIASKLVDLMKNEYNPEGLFLHPRSNNDTHLAFTGGEPMMNQKAIVDIMNAFEPDNRPDNITIETNATQPLTEEFKEFFSGKREDLYYPYTLISMSPKLFHVSGEPAKRAIKPEVIAEYVDFFDINQMKVVMNSDPRAWEELDGLIEVLDKEYNVHPNICIMPVGATDQSQQENGAAVANEAFKRGLTVSGRLHTAIYGNAIGT